jgi:tRNA(adenine34) deaminase
MTREQRKEAAVRLLRAGTFAVGFTLAEPARETSRFVRYRLQDPVEEDAMNDVDAMRLALDKARQGDDPFGAVIVKDGRLLVQAENRAVRQNDPTAHAEMCALRDQIAADPAALIGATIYATFEPCPMCAGACANAGISRIVYGVDARDLGQASPTHLSCAELIDRTASGRIIVEGGVLHDECLAFYRARAG